MTGVRALRVPAGLALPPDLSRNEVIHEITTGLYPLAGGQVPLILKPTFEGSSKGIRGNCLADSPEEAAETFGRLAEAYRQPILVEQFIQGDEVTVGLVGNGTSVEILGALRVIPRVATDRFVYSLEVKRDWTRLVDYEAPARLPEPVRNTLFEAARGAWQALGCRDLARIDFRIGPDGVPDFIEANPLPGLSPTTSDLVILARGHGLSYEDLIRKILHAALSRVDLRQREPVAS